MPKTDQRTLVSNVYVDGAWYGPDYPGNEVTEDVLDQIDNPAVFGEEDDEGGIDLRTRAADFAPGVSISSESIDLTTLSVAELHEEAAKRGIEVPERAKKADLIDALRSGGLSPE